MNLKHISRRRAAATLVMLIGLFGALSACGEESSRNPAGSGPVASPSVDAALAARVPESIKSKGKIAVGVDATYAPNEFLDTDGKTVIGWDVELFDAVARKLGLAVEWIPAPFDSLITGVASAKYDVAVSSFGITEKRKEQVTMISYFSAGTQWATKQGNPGGIAPDNACGKKVAVQVGTTQLDDIKAKSAACASAGKPPITIDQYQAQTDATTAVVSGKDDAMLADSPVCAYAVLKTNGQLQAVGNIYDAATYGLVVNKAQQAFAEAISAAVTSLITDGTYVQILKKWGVEGGATTSSAVNPPES